MKRIIAFAGRKESGKTELCKFLVQNGYKRIYFAQPLKELCSIIFNMTIDELNKLKYSDNDIPFPKDKIELFSEITELPLDYSYKMLYNKVFKDAREIFQYIGTDVIRKYDYDWHAKRTKELIIREKSDLICIDDLRFPNEKKILEEMNADLWFVTRQKLDNVSNHESETSLKWKDFKYIIENNSTLDDLLRKWSIYIQNYDEMSIIRNNMYKTIDSYIESSQKGIKIQLNEDILTSLKDIFYPISKLEYDSSLTDINKISKIIPCISDGKQYFHVIYKNGKELDITNILMIEDLKYYL